jgi:hypothetical protein
MASIIKALLHHRKQRVSITNASCFCNAWCKGNTILRNVGKYSSQDKASYTKDSNLQRLLPAPKRRRFLKFVFGIFTKICSQNPILVKKRQKYDTFHGRRIFSSRRESSLLLEHYALWGTSGGRIKAWRYKHNPTWSTAHCFRYR